MEKVLEFKWSVSRGRDSYGYNICSLWIHGKKVSSTCGGGYDMKGTALGNWIQKEFQKELNNLEIPMSIRNGEEIQEYYGLTFHDPNFDPGKVIVNNETIEEREKENKSLGLERYQAFYSASSRVPTKNHNVALLNGACGFSSMEKILNAIGYTLKYITENSKNTVYLLEEKNEEI